MHLTPVRPLFALLLSDHALPFTPYFFLPSIAFMYVPQRTSGATNLGKEFVMSRRILMMAVLVSLLGGWPASAAQRAVSQAEYSGDLTTQTEDNTTQQHVYVTPTKERRELLTGGGDGAVQIFRHDNKVMWQLMPSEKMYMEHQYGKSNAKDMSSWDFEETVVGEETLDGMKVTKYKTIATSTDGKKYGGFSWRTKEGIPIKTDLLYKEGNEKQRMATELKNVKIGKQDPKLFEVPEGFTKFDMAGMMGGMGGMMGGAGREGMGREGRPNMGRSGTGRPEVVTPPQETQPASETEPPADDRSDMQKAGDMMKKLFGK